MDLRTSEMRRMFAPCAPMTRPAAPADTSNVRLIVAVVDRARAVMIDSILAAAASTASALLPVTTAVCVSLNT